MSTQLLKNSFKSTSCLLGSNSFQGISNAGKPQVVSSYSFKSMGSTDCSCPKQVLASKHIIQKLIRQPLNANASVCLK